MWAETTTLSKCLELKSLSVHHVCWETHTPCGLFTLQFPCVLTLGLAGPVVPDFRPSAAE